MPPTETWLRWMLVATIAIGVPAVLAFGAVATGTVTSSDVGGTPMEPYVADVEESLEGEREEQHLDRTETELLIHERVNEVREERGLPPLEWHPELAEEAKAHSGDMIERDFYNHTNPDGEGPRDRTSTNCRAGENINTVYWQRQFELYEGSVVTAESEEELANYTVREWMNSDGHRKNVLDADYIGQGIGVKADGSKVLVTQMFCAPPG